MIIHGWIIHKDEEIEESWMDEVEKCIKSVCDHKIPIKLKEKNLQDFYKTNYALSYWNVGMLRSKIFIKWV